MLQTLLRRLRTLFTRRSRPIIGNDFLVSAKDVAVLYEEQMRESLR